MNTDYLGCYMFWEYNAIKCYNTCTYYIKVMDQMLQEGCTEFLVLAKCISCQFKINVYWTYQRQCAWNSGNIEFLGATDSDGGKTKNK